MVLAHEREGGERQSRGIDANLRRDVIRGALALGVAALAGSFLYGFGFMRGIRRSPMERGGFAPLPLELDEIRGRTDGYPAPDQIASSLKLPVETPPAAVDKSA